MDRGILPSLCKVRIQRYSGDEFIVSKNKINSKNEMRYLRSHWRIMCLHALSKTN